MNQRRDILNKRDRRTVKDSWTVAASSATVVGSAIRVRRDPRVRKTERWIAGQFFKRPVSLLQPTYDPCKDTNARPLSILAQEQRHQLGSRSRASSVTFSACRLRRRLRCIMWLGSAAWLGGSA